MSESRPFPRGLFSDRRCDLPVQSDPWPGHDGRRPGSMRPQEASLRPRGRQQRSARMAWRRRFFAAIKPVIAGSVVDVRRPGFSRTLQPGAQPPDDLENSLRFGEALMRLAMRDARVHELMLAVRHLITAGNRAARARSGAAGTNGNGRFVMGSAARMVMPH